MNTTPVTNADEKLYRRISNHPAYAQARQIVTMLDEVEDACRRFVGTHDADAMRALIGNRAIPEAASMCEGFEQLHADITHATWVLGLLSGIIDPAVPSSPRKGRAA